MSLLNSAKDFEKTIKKNGTKINDEHIELALAWVNDEIGFSSVSKAIYGKPSPLAYVMLARTLKEYICRSKLK